MTVFADQLKSGRAYYNRVTTQPVGYVQEEATGLPFTQVYVQQVGTASTALASGIFFSTATGVTGTLTCTGPLVSASIATLDVPRTVRISASVNLSSGLITIRGTDKYTAPITWTGIGPSGNTLGNNGSFVDTTIAFKTVLTASMTSHTSTAGLQIGTSDGYGLDFRLANKGMIVAITVDGNPASGTGNLVPSSQVGLAATGVATASGNDVRGLITLPTTNLANGSKFVSFTYVTPNVGVTAGNDTKENSYGVVPFTN